MFKAYITRTTKILTDKEFYKSMAHIVNKTVTKPALFGVLVGIIISLPLIPIPLQLVVLSAIIAVVGSILSTAVLLSFRLSDTDHESDLVMDLTKEVLKV